MKINFVSGLQDSEIQDFITDFYSNRVESTGWFWSTYSPKEVMNSITKSQNRDDYKLLIILRERTIEEYQEIVDFNDCTYSHFLERDIDL